WETEDIPVGMLLAGSVDGVTLTPDEIAAYDAPFPDPSYKAGVRAMPSRVPMLPNDPSVPAQIEAWKVFSQWTKPFLCAFADNDPVTGAARVPFEERVPGAKGQPHRTIEGGGHFLQEGRGKELATVVADFIDSTPVGD
ncbi:MAG: haloalkane dehalogenase, partial [bacterium]|nr:haloalkane dehalogenase [bacterium]